jgi:hypothetical protein
MEGQAEMTDLVEKVARALCWKNGMNPDLSLGGDKQNWLWMEYVDEADAVIKIVLEEAANVAIMRRNYWDQKSNRPPFRRIGADISCALSLSEECGDIANAIRALGEK